MVICKFVHVKRIKYKVGKSTSNNNTQVHALPLKFLFLVPYPLFLVLRITGIQIPCMRFPSSVYFFMLHRPWSGTTTFHCCTEKSLLTRPTRARQVSRYLFGVVCLTCFPKCAPASLLCCEYPDADLPFVINQITREP